MNNAQKQPENNENNVFNPVIPDEATEKNMLFEQIFQGNSEENGVDVQEMATEEETPRPSRNCIPKKRGPYRKAPKIDNTSLDATRETIDNFIRAYQEEKISECEFRAMIYGLRLMVNTHQGLRVRKIEEDNKKIMEFFHKKGIEI